MGGWPSCAVQFSLVQLSSDLLGSVRLSSQRPCVLRCGAEVGCGYFAVVEEFGTDPDQFAAQAYAAAQVIASFAKAGATTKEEMLRGLRSARIATTVLGPIGFDSNRDVKATPVVLQIAKDGFAPF